MGAFPALPLGRRPVRCRILAVYRLDPGAAMRILPDGLRPSLAHGHAILTACFTRLGAKPLFRQRDPKTGASDHLAYRIAVERADGSTATWIARRETSSWLEARCGARFLRGSYERAVFQVREEALAVEVSVEGEHGLEFYLRAEPAGPPPRSLFRGPQELESFLDEHRAVTPRDVFAPEADELDLAPHFSPEPLAVFEIRSTFLSAGALEDGAFELDSAWRLARRRLGIAGARRSNFRLLPEGLPSRPALPAP